MISQRREWRERVCQKILKTDSQWYYPLFSLQPMAIHLFNSRDNKLYLICIATAMPIMGSQRQAPQWAQPRWVHSKVGHTAHIRWNLLKQPDISKQRLEYGFIFTRSRVFPFQNYFPLSQEAEVP